MNSMEMVSNSPGESEKCNRVGQEIRSAKSNHPILRKTVMAVDFPAEATKANWQEIRSWAYERNERSELRVQYSEYFRHPCWGINE